MRTHFYKHTHTQSSLHTQEIPRPSGPACSTTQTQTPPTSHLPPSTSAKFTKNLLAEPHLQAISAVVVESGRVEETGHFTQNPPSSPPPIPPSPPPPGSGHLKEVQGGWRAWVCVCVCVGLCVSVRKRKPIPPFHAQGGLYCSGPVPNPSSSLTNCLKVSYPPSPPPCRNPTTTFNVPQ